MDVQFPKVAVVANWFGKPLQYFQLWLDSCARNPCITWMLFCDFSTDQYIVPSNVRVLQSSVASMRDRLQKHFAFPIRYAKAWDLCAFRPAFGSIFKDELVGYDYWGWCDCDVIFGDLSPCISELAKKPCKLLPKGHLSFVRNDSLLNEYIISHGAMKQAVALSSSGLPCFDEVGFSKDVLHPKGEVVALGLPFVNLYCRAGSFVAYDTEALCRALGVAGPGIKYPFVMTWVNGVLKAHFAIRGEVRDIELLYVHFFKREMRCIDYNSNQSAYLIKPNQILPYNGHGLSVYEILWLDRPRVHWKYFFKRMTLDKLLQKFYKVLGR